ncbi:twin-arginine translocation signal domain-containing protein [Flavobacterium sp. CS20]|uniref:twin-arginine translocation signal domain-containing protein n=1 Tax=Flavobacterium sp. CS20 TaxID=2775246 RepID=UPI001B39E11D|nr:twin-arginine translocation signal domain-containing protein [Flavobacterium sp. CS20]QTY28082.1 twin-arginine translocation signal domain-containing protein [Flavobacterium sp. CS20]
METKKKSKNGKPNRRDFLVDVSMAVATLTLNSAFGFPVATGQGNGKLFAKIKYVGGIPLKDNMYSFSENNLEKLKSGKMESLTIKMEASFDQRNWKTIETSITDRNFMKQLSEMAQKVE